VSGIVGILNLDGAPVDRRLLGGMTDFMAFRGPDARRIWTDGNIGFGHTLLKTTEESEREHQPFTLDGQVWIVADARVDAQRDLIAKLTARGEQVQRGVTDVELLLRAYRAWKEECVEHLLGDFAFAIWDAPRRRLFCARDQMGVKPFYYAQLGERVIFSNTLDCIRQHPAVSDTLNDRAIADFLLFDLNQDPAATSFADIRRLPPGNRATWSNGGSRISRYWTLPIDEPVYFRRADDYVDRFKELLHMAVDDRLRINNVGVFMSGGLDSSTLAATACQILRGRAASSQVHAFTTVSDGVVDQNERYYAELVAGKLRIPIHYRNVSGNLIDPHWPQTSLHTPEPVSSPLNLTAHRDYVQSVSSHSRVCLYGEGPDNALTYEWRSYLSHLVQHRRIGRLLQDISFHVIRHRRVPLLPTVRRIVTQRRRAGSSRSSFPEWLDESFEARLRLREQWEKHQQMAEAPSPHPVRPVAYRSFNSGLWESLFQGWDAGQTMAAFEVRHPFVDLRLLRYLLAVPAIPWCRAKYLVRRAMRGTLPEAVLRRPKAPLIGDPVLDRVEEFAPPRLEAVPALRAFVDPERVSWPTGDGRTAFWTNFRPRSLNYWLKNLQPRPYHIHIHLTEEAPSEPVTTTAN
jgi:asparagine synthase (glutamine-hydrolysing)